MPNKFNVKKNAPILIRVAFVFLFSVIYLSSQAQNEPESTFASAEKNFSAGNFSAASAAYSQLFEAGLRSEKLLLRLAQVNERAGNYSRAIYFLRLAESHYAIPDPEMKILELQGLNGCSTALTTDGFTGWYRFANRYGLIIGILFLLSAASAAVAAFLSRRLREKRSLMKKVFFSALGLSAVCGLFLLSDRLVAPERAVLVEETGFYLAPGFGAGNHSGAICPGETVYVVDENDIWKQIEAGRHLYWVPEWTLKSL